jgi:hypothetical protein
MGRRAGEIGLVVGVLFASALSSSAQGLLDPPVAVDAAVRSNASEIQPVRGDLPLEAARPAARMGGIRTATGETGTPSGREIEPAIRRRDEPRETDRRVRDDDDPFLNRRSTKSQLADFDPPPRKSSDRKSNRFGDLFGDNGFFFKGDDCFQNFISPVTNPHLFEDPRSLTEFRPTFYYQKVPTGQPEWRGGNLWYFGTSARLAINERWSVTLTKLGAVAADPGVAKSEFGFGEVHVGPKWTFLRDQDTETVAAAGLLFQIPVGNSSVYQDTGSLSLVPYLTIAQQIAETGAGSLNGLLAGGYSFSTNNQRSDYFYVSGNLNFDWANRHRFYPLVEMNWFTYTTNGRGRPGVGFEARDFANLGGQASGSNLLTAAFGARYKINERAQIGGAYEIPFLGNRDLFRHRFTFDFIIRF